jgi:hypothetical protein
MEFTRLADVEVVETAADADKVLIEQNGEIKRVPKTEVGGSGNILIIDVSVDTDTSVATGTTNMPLDETIAAIANRELTGAVAYTVMIKGGQIMTTMLDVCVCADYTAQAGVPALMILCAASQLPLIWTADGFQMAG